MISVKESDFRLRSDRASSIILKKLLSILMQVFAESEDQVIIEGVNGESEVMFEAIHHREGVFLYCHS